MIVLSAPPISSSAVPPLSLSIQELRKSMATTRKTEFDQPLYEIQCSVQVQDASRIAVHFYLRPDLGSMLPALTRADRTNRA